MLPRMFVPAQACTACLQEYPLTQQRVTFEWITDEHRGDFWRALPTDEQLSQHKNAELRAVVYILRGMALFLIVITAAAGAGLTAGERERREAQKGIAFVLGVENQAWERRDRGLYQSLIDPYIEEDWVTNWSDHWRAGADATPDFAITLIDVREIDGLMQATVDLEEPAFEWWQTNPTREERFYRRVDQRWVRTVPPAATWGEARELQTEHLHFVFYERDAVAVEEAAPKLEAAYTAMYHTLGLQQIPQPKPVIAIMPAPVGRWSASANELHVTSPLLSSIPIDQSDSDYLAYEVMGWFTYRAMRDATPDSGVRYLYRWPILVWGLRGWLRDELLAQPSPWHVEAAAVLQESAPQYLPVGLQDITDLRANTRPSRKEVILRYLTAESFVRFVVDTYGREHLPNLLEAMVRFGDWNEIIPHVYNRSIPEFEDAWNKYIIKEYELDGLRQ